MINVSSRFSGRSVHFQVFRPVHVYLHLVSSESPNIHLSRIEHFHTNMAISSVYIITYLQHVHVFDGVLSNIDLLCVIQKCLID